MTHERLTLLKKLGIPRAVLVRVDVLLRLHRAFGVPAFRPFGHGALLPALDAKPLSRWVRHHDAILDTPFVTLMLVCEVVPIEGAGHYDDCVHLVSLRPVGPTVHLAATLRRWTVCPSPADLSSSTVRGWGRRLTRRG